MPIEESSQLRLKINKRFYISDGTPVTLRPVQPNDLDKLLVYINSLVQEKQQDKRTRLFTGFEDKFSRRMESRYLDETLAGIQSGKIINLAAEIDGRIVANGEIERGSYKETEHYGRLGLTIIPEFRGRGLGREMVRALLREARRRRLKRVQVEFLATNSAAVRTYRKAGFKKAGLLPGKVFRNGELIDSLIMVRNL